MAGEILETSESFTNIKMNLHWIALDFKHMVKSEAIRNAYFTLNNTAKVESKRNGLFFYHVFHVQLHVRPERKQS